jgi:enamine deaminase RidA (YjgF/YER057c/UK114 family)
MISHIDFSTLYNIKEDFFTAAAAPGENFEQEAAAVLKEYENALPLYGCSRDTEMLLRFHLSDVTNQVHILKELLQDRCACISIIGQPPVNGSRIALEAWHWSGITKEKNRSLKVTTRNYAPLWFNLEELDSVGSYDQTYEEFSKLKEELAANGANVADHTVRTWLYCRDVDNNYAGLVHARNDFFAENGLTRDTHFIASTGIEGQSARPDRLVRMDSINIPGLENGQTVYLSAPEMLSPTAIYGVSFERGTKIVFGDRSHIFISGTASIDHEGKVLHLYDVVKQTGRMLDNIEALLNKADADAGDIKIAALYLRDPADAAAVLPVIRERFGETLPLVAMKAPVCRPEWLVEMECIAVNSHGDKRFRNFC